jgi:hypothetical protein
VTEIASGLLKAKEQFEVQTAVSEMLAKVIEVQHQVGAVHDRIEALRDENAGLREKLKDLETWEQRSSQYGLVELGRGTFVWRYNATSGNDSEQPVHYACPVCFEASRLTILQGRPDYLLTCPSCSADYIVKCHSTGGGSY